MRVDQGSFICEALDCNVNERFLQESLRTSMSNAELDNTGSATSVGNTGFGTD